MIIISIAYKGWKDLQELSQVCEQHGGVATTDSRWFDYDAIPTLYYFEDDVEGLAFMLSDDRFTDGALQIAAREEYMKYPISEDYGSSPSTIRAWRDTMMNRPDKVVG